MADCISVMAQFFYIGENDNFFRKVSKKVLTK